MPKVFSKTVVVGSGNEAQASQSLVDKAGEYAKEQYMYSENMRFLQSSSAAHVTLTIIVR